MPAALAFGLTPSIIYAVAIGLLTLLVAVLLGLFFLPDAAKARLTRDDKEDSGKNDAAARVSNAPRQEKTIPPTVARESEPQAAAVAAKSARPGKKETPQAALAKPAPLPEVVVSLPDRLGGGKLWLLRSVAVQRLVDEHICKAEASKIATSVKRRIWGFLNDQPKIIATGCADGQARLYDLQNGRMLVSVRHDTGSREPLNSVYLSAGPTLFTGSWDGRKHLWDAWPQKPARPSEFARGEKGVGHENLVTGIALSRDGNTLACACTVGCVLVFRSECPIVEIDVVEQEDLDRLREGLKLGDYSELFLKEDFELGGTILEQNMMLLQEASFKEFSSRRDVSKLELPARLHFRFVGCLTRGHKRAWRRLQHEGAVHSIAISPEGHQEFLYSGSRDKTLKKWNLSDGTCVHTYEGHTSMVRSLAVNSCYLASGSDDRSIRIWQKDSPSVIRTITGHTDFVRAVALCPTFTERLVSSGEERRVYLWDVRNGERLMDYAHDTIVTTILLRESRLLTGADDGRLRIWRTESSALEQQLRHPGGVRAISLK